MNLKIQDFFCLFLISIDSYKLTVLILRALIAKIAVLCDIKVTNDKIHGR